MDTFSFIFSGVMVYVSIAVFVLGMGWRVWQWVRTPKSPVPLPLYPVPKSASGRVLKSLKDTFVAPQSFEIAPGVMIAAMAFHLAALAGFVGHLRLVHEFTPLVSLLGDEGMATFAAWSGGIAGIVMMSAVVYWLSRRTFGAYKNLSTPEDYLLLALLLGIIIMGNEGKGISQPVKALVNHRLLIPNYPKGRKTADSLNVAIATAITCAEFRRRI